MLSAYYPDFIVKIKTDLYLVETKAQKDVKDANVKQKELGALDRLKKINALNPDNRMGCEWHYVLLGETTFYTMRDKGALIKRNYGLFKADAAEGQWELVFVVSTKKIIV